MFVADADKMHVQIASFGLAAAEGSTDVPTLSLWHYRRTSNVNPLSKTGIDTAWQAAVGVPIKDALNVTWSQEYNRVRFLEDPTDPDVQIAHVVPGVIAGDRMSPDKTAFLYFKSVLRGRSYQGKKYLSPMSESDSTAGTADLFNVAALARLQAIANAHVAGFTDAQGNVWIPVVFSRHLSDLTVSPCVIVSSDVAQGLVNKRIGRFKRRQVASQY